MTRHRPVARRLVLDRSKSIVVQASSLNQKSLLIIASVAERRQGIKFAPHLQQPDRVSTLGLYTGDKAMFPAGNSAIKAGTGGHAQTLWQAAASVTRLIRDA